MSECISVQTKLNSYATKNMYARPKVISFQIEVRAKEEKLKKYTFR